MEEGKLLWKNEENSATSMAYLPGGGTAVLGIGNGKLELWDLDKREKINSIQAHTDEIKTILLAANGDLVWTADRLGKLRLSKLPRLEPVAALGEVKDLSKWVVSPNGRILACLDRNGKTIFLDARTARVIGERPAKLPTETIVFASDTELLVGRANPVRLQLDIEMPATPTLTRKLDFMNLFEGPQLNEGNANLIYSADGKFLMMRQKELTIVDAGTGFERSRLRLDRRDPSANAFVFGPEGKIVRTNDAGKIQIWDSKEQKLLKELDIDPTRPGASGSLFTSNDPNRVLVTIDTPDVFWFDVAAGKVVEKLTPFPNRACVHAAVYPDGSKIVFQTVADLNRSLAVWDVTKKAEAFPLEQPAKELREALVLSSNGKWIVGHELREPITHVWNAETGKRATLETVPSKLCRGGFLADANLYVFCDMQSGTRLVVDLAKDQVIEPASQSIPSGVAVTSPAHNLLASFDSDRKLRLWRINGARQPPAVAKADPKTTPAKEGGEGLIKSFPRLADAVSMCSFTADGGKIIVVLQNGSVHVFDAAKFEEVAKFDTVKATVLHAYYKPKSKLVSGSADRLYIMDDDRIVTVWDVDKKTKAKEYNLDKLMTKIERLESLVVTPTESHLMGFEATGIGSFSLDLARNVPGILAALNRAPFSSSTRVVTFSADGRFAAAFAAGKAMVWVPATGANMPLIDPPGVAKWLAVLPDANTVVMSTRNQLLAYHFAPTGTKQTMDVRDPHGRFNDDFQVAAPLKGKTIASYGRDQKLRIWDVETGREKASWEVEKDVRGMAMSPDGSRVILWHDDNTQTIWAMPPAAKEKK